MKGANFKQLTELDEGLMQAWQVYPMKKECIPKYPIRVDAEDPTACYVCYEEGCVYFDTNTGQLAEFDVLTALPDGDGDPDYGKTYGSLHIVDINAENVMMMRYQNDDGFGFRFYKPVLVDTKEEYFEMMKTL